MRFGMQSLRTNMRCMDQWPKSPKDGIDRSAAERQCHPWLNQPVEICEVVLPAFYFSSYPRLRSTLTRFDEPADDWCNEASGAKVGR